MTAFDFFNVLLSIPKTLRFNLHYFPLKTAIKFPVFVSHRTFLREMHGHVALPSSTHTAMVKIGFGDVGHYDRKRSRTIWQVSGTVTFNGNAGIGHGSKISVRGNLILGAGFNMTAESTIVCAKEITFGEDCLLGWDTLLMDTDEHSLLDMNGNRTNPDKAIIVGNHVWIGCKCTLLKGTAVPDNTTVAACTLLTSSFTGTHQVIGGNPPAVLKSDVNWEH